MAWPWSHHKKEPKELIFLSETVVIIDDEIWMHHSHHEHGKKHPHPVRMVHTITLNNTKIQIMAFDPLPVGNKAPIQVALQDVVTLQPTQDAVSSNVVNVSDNPSAANIDADNNLVAVAEGSGNVTTDADWTYTNSLGVTGQTTHQTVTTPFTVTAVQTANGVQMVVTLGTPVPA